MMYTAKLDYYATGEGRTLMILIGDYRNIDEVKEAFSRHFDPYFTMGAEIIEGIDISGFESIIPANIIEAFNEGKEYYNYYTAFHMNFA